MNLIINYFVLIVTKTVKYVVYKNQFCLHLDNEKDNNHDVCFTLALIAHEKDKRFTETGGIKQIFDELLTLNIPKYVPKIVFIEVLFFITKLYKYVT